MKMVDVLFINGCDQSVPHPPRYRVTHQREQLESCNITTDEVFYTEVDEDTVKCANLFIIFRCPYIDAIGTFVEQAHALNKKVLFDIDDLVVSTKYTDLIPYVQGLEPHEKEVYDDGVIRMGKTLSLCDGAITTTKALGDELARFVPHVYINRNVASDEMYARSQEAIRLCEQNYEKDVMIDEEHHIVVPIRKENEVRIGYFSGSITHNADIELIMPALVELLKNHRNVNLYLVGELDIPEPLKAYEKQIYFFPFMDWKNLPKLIAMVDINLGPLEDSIFNRAKSENKWTEAALVNVVTVASDVGAFAEVIENGITGYLCEDNQWSEVLEKLVTDSFLRKSAAKNANVYVKKHYVTIYSGFAFAEYIKEFINKTAVLVLPSTEISGGIMVALQHMAFLAEEGYAVTVLAENPSLEWMSYRSINLPVVRWHVDEMQAYFSKGIATLWTTMEFVEKYPRLGERYYLVQGFETDLYDSGIPFRRMANSTYCSFADIKYITISKWCQNWLLEDYKKESQYAPNGIEKENFVWKERDFGGKIRILIEGDSAVTYKGVDESFKIANQLDPKKYEIWYMSYNGRAKEWYRVDKFLHRIPYTEVSKVYEQCHILVKSSWVESFSYPPLEMMTTGGYVVVVLNGGNAEYLKDHENCLLYELGNIQDGIDKVYEIVNNEDLRVQLQRGMKNVAVSRDWKTIRSQILALYDISC